MAALDIITRLVKPNSSIIAGDDLYGGTNRLLNYLRNNNGVTVHHVDTTKPSSILPYLTTEVSMVLLESPTNPLLKIVDLAKISAQVKERAPDAIVVVDNTMMSPYLQRPLEHGADIVYDSATKYLSGHHDLMAGVIVCNRDDLAKRIAFMINSVGNGLSPFDSFLLLRGVKTLAIRMDRQQTAARLVAEMLHGLGFDVFYPGLESHPDRDVHERISNGPGAVLSFTTGDKGLSEKIVAATRLWGISVSFGCVNSLISMPCAMSCVKHLPLSISDLIQFFLYPGTLRLIPQLEPLEVSPRTSSASVSESKIRAICWMTWSMPYLKPEPSSSLHQPNTAMSG